MWVMKATTSMDSYDSIEPIAFRLLSSTTAEDMCRAGNVTMRQRCDGESLWH